MKGQVSWFERMAFLAAHPVGEYYWTSNAENPSNKYGRTWTQIKDVFLLAAGDKYAEGRTGGESENVLTIEQMPRHRHIVRHKSSNPSTEYDAYIATSDLDNDVSSSASDGVRRYTTYEGENAAHNNMPPYLAAYCWQRTA